MWITSEKKEYFTYHILWCCPRLEPTADQEIRQNGVEIKYSCIT